MQQPSIDHLLSVLDSKYGLVIVAAKRARNLNEGSPETIDTASRPDLIKKVSIALEEIGAETLEIQKPVAKLK